jgi:hypothetical protein
MRPRTARRVVGGATGNTSGSYWLGGTITQPEAAVSRSGAFTLVGGFWGEAAGPQYSLELPLLVLNPPSLTRSEPGVKSAGRCLWIRRSARSVRRARASARLACLQRTSRRRWVPANRDRGDAWRAQRRDGRLAQVETIENVSSEQLSARHRGALEANKPALKRGYLYAMERVRA